MAKEGSASVAARDLGQGWKVNPYVIIEPGATFELANIAGQGAIQQIWMTLARGKWRFSILRAYWDDQAAAVDRGADAATSSRAAGRASRR